MQSVREVYSLLMPIKDGRMVIPRAAVAEVMGYSKPKERPENAPDFLLGFVEWQGQRIPLVSFEAARGHGVPELGRRTRIAVVFGIGGRLNPDVFAVVTQGYPYLVRVNENVLQREEMEHDDPLILTRVRMANEKPYIPDLEALENRIADSLGLAHEAPAAPVDNMSDELDTLAGEEDDFETVLAEDDEIDAPAPDVDDFGTETNYSVELDELSAVLTDDNADNNGSASDEDYTIELDGLEVDTEQNNTDDPFQTAVPSAPDEKADEDIGEFDLSDLEIELDDGDEERKD